MKSEVENLEIPRVVIVGHIDHGKSSFIGRLMYDLDQVPKGKFDELKQACDKRGVELEYAFLLDALQVERDQRITIDTTQIFFKTTKRNYIFIDAPGHKEFIRNMVTGASSANIALLVVDVFEGLKEQTRKHAYLLKLLGISKVITLYNKMDKIKYDEKVFKNVEGQLEEYLAKINVKSVCSVPISAKYGDNIVEKSTKMNWYKSNVFIDVLDKYKVEDLSGSENLRLPVQDIYKINDKRTLVGRVESGKLEKRDELLLLPSNEKIEIQSFEVWPNSEDHYQAGDCVALTLSEQIFVDKGNMISHFKNPPKLMNSFEANVFWLSEKKLSIKEKYTMKINTGEYIVSIEKIKNIINTENLNAKKNFANVSKNEICELILHSPQLIPMDDFSKNQKTGRFCLLDAEEIVAGGIINLKNYPDQREANQKSQSNIVPVDFAVTEIDRVAKIKHRPAIIWLTGLSGSGKSTIAKEVEKRLFLKNFHVIVLDGDNLRLGLNKGLTFSPEDRTENIRRTAEVAKLFSQAGFVVLVSLISPYRSERKKARDIRPEIFREIYVKASVKECTKRDVKGLYARAIKGEIMNFTGVSSPYEMPYKPDLVLDTEKESVEESVTNLLNFIVSNFGIR